MAAPNVRAEELPLLSSASTQVRGPGEERRAGAGLSFVGCTHGQSLSCQQGMKAGGGCEPALLRRDAPPFSLRAVPRGDLSPGIKLKAVFYTSFSNLYSQQDCLLQCLECAGDVTAAQVSVFGFQEVKDLCLSSVNSSVWPRM